MNKIRTYKRFHIKSYIWINRDGRIRTCIQRILLRSALPVSLRPLSSVISSYSSGVSYSPFVNFNTRIIPFDRGRILSAQIESEWTLSDLNTEPSGYEPDALTDCAKSPKWSFYRSTSRNFNLYL